MNYNECINIYSTVAGFMRFKFPVSCMIYRHAHIIKLKYIINLQLHNRRAY